MRWQGREGSSNVEDRRGMGLSVGRGSLGCGGILLVGIIALLTGTDPSRLLQLLQGQAEQQQQPAGEPGAPARPPADELGSFASVVLKDTETTWEAVFARAGRDYEEPRLVLFSRAVRSACGTGTTAVGPFYCRLDRSVYLDTSFFSELGRRFGAPGDFAAAYVIAHEVGHHVQTLLGIAQQAERAQRGAQANAVSVRMELQADCFAGVWGHHANRERNLIEPGDFEEGLRAAAAIGDDRLQSLGQGYVQPESWTHGSSEQRAAWLKRGLESGDPDACDTFNARRP
jgi:predicted metalloprotease